MTPNDLQVAELLIALIKEMLDSLKWAERQLHHLVTDDDGSGTFIRGTGTELGGFCIGRDQMRDVIRTAEKLCR